VQYGAVLLSRQPRRPCGRNPWVRQTVQAVHWLVDHGYGIISSVGLQTWELITAAAVDRGATLRLVVPAQPMGHSSAIKANIENDFVLSSGAAGFEFIPASDKRQFESARDTYIVGAADLLIPVSVRPGGSMQELIDGAVAADRLINRDFVVPYESRRERLAYTIDSSTISPDIARIGQEYLVHWTRTANGPWPGERRIEYYRDLIAADRYSRAAFDTLKHILSTRTIIASSRHMPGKIPSVSFTGLSPREVVPLMRWRSRFGEMSFEPYGLGVRREMAAQLGIRPVVYGERPQARHDQRAYWLTQSAGTRTDWRQELEFRYRGDLDLAAVPNDQLVAFCLRPGEAGDIAARFGISACSFQEA
jgi:hypothetical protein